jgi:glyoxylase-like metal-dependent hydrolase (beta-lactamase superfamily II)
MKPNVQAFFDPVTGTVSYVVHDRPGGFAAIVDSVLDYDPKSGRTSTHSADRIVAFVESQGLAVQWILETHAHADHLSAAPCLRSRLGGRIAIGAAITTVQHVFKGVFHLEPGFRTDGAQFDHLLNDGETFRIGEMEAKAMSVPTRWAMPFSWATPSSCPTWARPAATFPVATPTRCTARCASC